MSEQKPHKGPLRSIGSGGLVLWLYGLVASAVIATTYLNTKEQIIQQQRLAKQQALAQIITSDQHDNDLLDDSFILQDVDFLGLQQPAEAYRVRLEDKVVAIILPVTTAQGYGGAMQMIVGINRNGQLAGVRVLTHNETPGLGDKIDARKSDWITGFKHRSLTNPKPEKWQVAKDGGEFDQFTGATITPRAVVRAVYRSLQYFTENRSHLLEEKSDTAGPTSTGETANESKLPATGR
jgi:electron transport complex protein RnfG